MQFLLDHALAVVCGAALIIGALSLQTQTRLHNVQETVSGAARTQAVGTSSVLTEEFDNMLSGPQSTALFGSYLARLMRDPSNARTDTVEFPAYVRTSVSGTPTPGHVRYRLVADGDSVQTSGGWVTTYRLEREINLGTGYGAPTVIGVNLVDFDVTFRGRASERTAGTPPLRFTQVGFELAVAMPDLEGDRRYHNVARVSHLTRPPNLTVGT